jgi:hypothetical protein
VQHKANPKGDAEKFFRRQTRNAIGGEEHGNHHRLRLNRRGVGHPSSQSFAKRCRVLADCENGRDFGDG